MGQTTSNRKEHKESLEATQSSDLKAEAGKKGGEVSSHGHGPATHQNREHRGTGGKDKRKQKTD